MERSIKSKQRKVRMLAFRIEGSTGTPSIEGLDNKGITVADTAVGTYTITFSDAFAEAPHVVATVEGADKVATVGSITASGCVVKVNDVDETPALSDDDVQVIVIGHDITDNY
jgi:hypothetical protein